MNIYYTNAIEPNTPFEEIKKIPAGNYLKINIKTLKFILKNIGQ